MKKKKQYYLLLVWLSSVVFMFNDSFAQKNNLTCADWQSRVDFNKPLVLVNPENKSQEEIFLAVKCLLQLEGKKEESNVAGASDARVSNFFGATSVEVAALYYVSYLYYQKWNHASAPFLVNQRESKLNSDKAVSKAYKAYKKWFEKVREIGLEEARKRKLDPLLGSGVRWY